APAAAEVPERAAHEAHLDRSAGIVPVLRSEGVMKAAHADGERRAHAFPGPLFHPRAGAPGQESRIRFDIVDQRVQVARRMLHYRGAGDALHELESPMSIVENRKAFHDYFIEERFEAGLVLEGWEVKAIRAGRANIAEAYVVVRNGEIVL